MSKPEWIPRNSDEIEITGEGVENLPEYHQNEVVDGKVVGEVELIQEIKGNTYVHLKGVSFYLVWRRDSQKWFLEAGGGKIGQVSIRKIVSKS